MVGKNHECFAECKIQLLQASLQHHNQGVRTCPTLQHWSLMHCKRQCRSTVAEILTSHGFTEDEMSFVRTQLGVAKSTGSALLSIGLTMCASVQFQNSSIFRNVKKSKSSPCTNGSKLFNLYFNHLKWGSRMWLLCSQQMLQKGVNVCVALSQKSVNLRGKPFSSGMTKFVTASRFLRLLRVARG